MHHHKLAANQALGLCHLVEPVIGRAELTPTLMSLSRLRVSQGNSKMKEVLFLHGYGRPLLEQTFTAQNGDRFTLSWSRGDPTCSLSIFLKGNAKQKTGLNEDQVVEQVTELVSQLHIKREPALVFAGEVERAMKEWWKKTAKNHFRIVYDTKYGELLILDSVVVKS